MVGICLNQFPLGHGYVSSAVRRIKADEYKPSNKLAFVLFEKLGIPEPEITNKMIVALLSP